MASVTYARRYAQAALELGLEHNDLEVWRRDLALLEEVWQDPDRRAYLEDVRVSKQARIDRSRALLSEHLSPLALNMLLLLISRGRTSLIPYIARHFADLERQRDETVVAHVTSAQELTPEQRQEISTRLAQQTGKEIQLETDVNPAILGGLVIKVEDRLLDVSVAGMLSRMRDQVVGRRAS